MKKIIILFLLAVCIKALAQKDHLFISVVLPETSELPTPAVQQLKTKMTQLLTENGVSSEDPANRFVISARVDVTSKDIVASTPQRVSEKINLTLMTGDIVDNKLFETITLPLIGIGTNETKAYIYAINQVKPQNASLATFLKKSKQKIVDYYTVRCPQIIKQARLSASNKDYDSAIYQLMQIPDICDCADQAHELMIKLVIQRNNEEASKILNDARAHWAASPNAQGANEVAQILADAPQSSSVQPKIDTLLAEIGKKLRDDERREWNFKMKEYNDALEREKREFSLRAYQQAADNQYRDRSLSAHIQAERQEAEDRNKERIARYQYQNKMLDMARSVGLSYARHLPKTVTLVKNIYTW